MIRFSDWEQRLSDYILSKRDEPFAYGTNDCCTFISGAVIAQTGVDPMAEYRGKYSTLTGSVRALKKIGGGDLEHVLNGKFKSIPKASAKRGDIVFHDGCAGVCAGRFAWFVSDEGLTRTPFADWQAAWSAV